MNRSEQHSPWHRQRLRAEKRFRRYGQCALGLAVVMLVILLGSIFTRGWPGFFQTQLKLAVTFDALALGIEGEDVTGHTPMVYQKLAQNTLKAVFPEAAADEGQARELIKLLSPSTGLILKRTLELDPSLLNKSAEVWVPASSHADLYNKGVVSDATPEAERRLSDQQVSWFKMLRERSAVRKTFNTSFFTQGDSRTPEQAGFLGSMAGSALTLIVCLLVVFPVGVMTAVYLEEFARKSRLVDLIEVNINNLAAVPSIVFGLLGLAVYINLFGLPRSAPLVGGMTLALMILPVIIITTRASLASIPDSIRDAARALGATPLQVVWHHVLPLAMPGVMTGTILGMARAIGETAPLLMIGMVAFVADIPSGFTSPATVMPVQIYLWAGSPETGFVEKTAAGILTLLVLLLAMNALAIYLRKRFEVRW